MLAGGFDSCKTSTGCLTLAPAPWWMQVTSWPLACVRRAAVSSPQADTCGCNRPLRSISMSPSIHDVSRLVSSTLPSALPSLTFLLSLPLLSLLFFYFLFHVCDIPCWQLLWMQVSLFPHPLSEVSSGPFPAQLLPLSPNKSDFSPLTAFEKCSCGRFTQLSSQDARLPSCIPPLISEPKTRQKNTTLVFSGVIVFFG